jgi:20S proteasome alpha/beta subunit
MSLVIAIKDKDRIVLGADKQVSTGGSKEHTSTKIWPVEELPGAVMGSVGSARASQIIQYASVIDKNLISKDIDTDFIICSLAPTIAAGLKANGFNLEVKENELCELMPNSFIFAYKDRAWLIWNDLSVSELEEYFAIGSGSDVAKGALFATKKHNPFERIVTAIDAASESTLFVDDGIDLLATGEHDGDNLKIAKALGFEIEEVKEELKKSEAKAKKTKKK